MLTQESNPGFNPGCAVTHSKFSLPAIPLSATLSAKRNKSLRNCHRVYSQASWPTLSMMRMRMTRVDITSRIPPSPLPIRPDRNPEGSITPLRILDTHADRCCRWPLALRFIKGAIHAAIMLPVTLHGLFAALVVFLNQHLDGRLGLPASIVCRSKQRMSSYTSRLTGFQIPSLSIVVGLMLASPMAQQKDAEVGLTPQ